MPRKKLTKDNGVDGYQLASRDRIHLVEKMVKENGKIDIDKLCSILRYKYGFHPATTKSYINTLVDLNKVIIVETDDPLVSGDLVVYLNKEEELKFSEE